MKFNSPLFDKIRVKPGEDRRTRAPDAPCCEWKGCNNAATHRAPKGRDSANEHWRFCLEHVREYNASYNYFDGMSTDESRSTRRMRITGHRPTWKMGTGNTPGGWIVQRHRSAQPVPRVQQRRRLAEEVRARRAEAHDPQRRAQGVRSARPRGQRRGRRDQGALQGTGEAPPSRRQRRRPRLRGKAARDHHRVQLSEVGQALLSGFGRCAGPASIGASAGGHRAASFPRLRYCRESEKGPAYAGPFC